MIEINVTEFVLNEEPTLYSDSIHNSGLDNIGQITWNRALDRANNPDEPHYLTTPESQQAFRDYVSEFGAWPRDEIDSWDTPELEALFFQFIAGEINELECIFDHTYLNSLEQADIDLFEHKAAAGQISASIYPVLPDDPDNEPTQWYFTISH